MAQDQTAAPRSKRGLSAKLLRLTSLFVLLAVVAVYVPALASFYERWLADRLGRAHSVALVLDAAPQNMVPETLSRRLLDSVGAKLIVLKTGEERRLLASSDTPPMVSREVDLREDPSMVSSIGNAFGVLFSGGKGVIRLVGDAPMGGEFVEVVIDEAPLRAAMFRFSRTMLGMSLVVAAIGGLLVYLLLDRMIVRPVRNLTDKMVAFGRDPENADAIVVPSGSDDEIGIAETELAAMQRELHDQLQSKGHLAALGLAVAKINHDLRNLLASAQLASERLAASQDPFVSRLSSKLVTTLERAVAYCATTLSYGAAKEPAPQRRQVEIAGLVRDVREALDLDESAVRWSEAIERGLTVDADPDQLFRVLLNLGRNAKQALESRIDGPDPERDQIRVVGRREGAIVVLEISDTGPGVPDEAKDHLFAAFQGSTRSGGTGLGLAIASELVRAHGGEIRLIEGTIGATFRITLPDRVIDLRARAAERSRA
ncbi:ATPase [Terrihabitans soli]|uniref:histidine kinase n=1 Tax=Terrihabitans soli TaxID=708113 RepID=A0A6S6QNA9_9HYPH|nr:HAMP domain-containing sensor histidine kinase [Terrihabitans soli]BCJ91994.1 ATPase [Terrihabitans soli]